MKKYIQFESEGDKFDILFEADEKENFDGLVNIGDNAAETIVVKAEKTFDNAMESVRKVSSSVISKIKNIADSPDEIQVEFGISFTASAGVVISKVETEAHMTLTLSWKKKANA